MNIDFDEYSRSDENLTTRNNQLSEEDIINKTIESYQSNSDFTDTFDIKDFSNDASLKSWDLETGELLLSFESSYPIKYICLNPDNNETAIISMEGNKIMVVNYHYGTIVREMTTSILAFSAYVIGIGQDYPNYLVGFYHDRIDLYDIKSGLLLKSKPSGMVLNWPEQHIGNCLLKAHGTNAFIAAKTYPYVICIDIKSLSEMWKIDISEGPKQSHVTSLSIGGRWINGEESIVFCNGMNNNISIRSIKNGSDLKTFKGCSDDSIELIETLEDLPAIYYENYKTVGFIDLKDESREPILPHPCQIRKIVAIGENLILTLSEDNIIRLWDRSLDTFSPDMSAFTGKYTLPPGISVDFLQNLMVQICPDIANDDGAMPDIKKFFTNSNMVKYWIRSDGTNYEGTSYMFIKFNNSNEFASRYLITTQNIVTNDLNVDICCTIWDLSKLTAVRRIFISPEYSFTTKCTFGETLIIMTSCTKKCIVAVDSIEVKVKNSLRNMEYIYNSKFIPFSSFNCIAYQKTKSIISFISPEMQIIGEFDIGQYDDKIHQIEKDKHENVLFVLSAETYNVYILNPSTLQQIKKISAFKYLNKTSMTVELVYQDTCYLLLCDHSVGSKFINIDLNPEHAMIYPSYDVTLMTSNDIDYYILLLYYEKENSVSILSTKAIGKNFNCMKKFIGENCIYAVIWSSDGYERTFYYLKTSDDKHSIDHIASFTLDNEGFPQFFMTNRIIENEILNCSKIHLLSVIRRTGEIP
ncbi:hypothetical protein A3Q56_01692 [Intoshia linei]|uniref:Uncharacterized protein n=1 Tax=Intoshia linei TaxID=1819745 RepID=A0A177BAS5_9BILA|nr:hypothetical protein A3Q56_01692 [Intoshia linei]